MPIDILFFGFAAVIVLPLLYMIFTKNIIRAAFAFALSLLGLAAVYVLLNAEFMAVVQVLIYAGGILILLIFGVMLTKRGKEAGVFTAHHQVWGACILVLALMVVLVKSILVLDVGSGKAAEVSQQAAKVGVLYLTDHLVAFELIAFLLLMALVGAAFLAKKSDQK